LPRASFDGKTEDLDKQIRKSLSGVAYDEAISPATKSIIQWYVAKVTAHGKISTFLAMADLNEHGTAQSDQSRVEIALKKLGITSPVKEK